MVAMLQYPPVKQARNILEGVECLNREENAALCFVGSLAAAMRYIGVKANNDYLMGISGGAFQTFWIPPWSPANADLLAVGEEPIWRAFSGLGYEYSFIEDYDHQDRVYSKAYLSELIMRSIDVGLPVLALGIVGPPECCVITGYENGGNALYGRSYFQDSFTDYFYCDGWYENCYGLILTGKKIAKPSPMQLLRDSLKWAIRLTYIPQFTGHISLATRCSKGVISGIAAYDAMTDALLRDIDFPKDLAVLTFRAYALGNEVIHIMAQKRQSAVIFLSEMADYLTINKTSLNRAAEAYAFEVKVWQQAMRLMPNSNASEKERLTLAEPEMRYEIARLLQQAKAFNEQAVSYLEEALTQLNFTAEQ